MWIFIWFPFSSLALDSIKPLCSCKWSNGIKRRFVFLMFVWLTLQSEKNAIFQEVCVFGIFLFREKQGIFQWIYLYHAFTFTKLPFILFVSTLRNSIKCICYSFVRLCDPFKCLNSISNNNYVFFSFFVGFLLFVCYFTHISHLVYIIMCVFMKKKKLTI